MPRDREGGRHLSTVPGDLPRGSFVTNGLQLRPANRAVAAALSTDRTNAYEWTDKAYDILVAGQLEASVHRRQNLEVAVVVGACPQCGHAFRFETTNVAIGVGGSTLGPAQPGPSGEAKPANDYVPITASC